MNGKFKARAKEAQFGHSSTGKEQIAVMFELSGEHAGRTLTWFGYFTDETVDRTFESLRHCGWDTDNIVDALGQIGANEVELVVEEETYEGKTRDRVKFVNRPYRLAVKEPMSAQAQLAFAARLKGKAIASKKAYGAQPAGTGPAKKPQSSRGAAADDYAGADAGYSDDDF
jgi:hypothetical protein